MFPETLYKYRDWEIDFHKSFLLKDEIFLTPAKLFNDPFDSTVPIRYDTLTEQEIFERNYEYLKKVQPNLKRNERRKMAREQQRKKLHKDPNHLKWFNQFQKDYYSEKFGIYSLTTDSKNIIMWSHYANAHKGFCVGFDTTKFLNSREFILQNTDIIIDLYKVGYHPDYPFLNLKELEEKDPDGYLVKPLLTKSSSWEYEKEYRLISLTGANISVTLPDGIISKVILGCRMKDAHKEELKNALKDKNTQIELQEAKMKEESFGLDFVQIQY